ncbi:MAG: hypothetical protein WDN09_04240 [bacterium]
MKTEKILEGAIHLDKLMGIQVAVVHHLGTDAFSRPQTGCTYYQVINEYDLGNYDDIEDGAEVTFKVEEPGISIYRFGVTQTRSQCTILTIKRKGQIIETTDYRYEKEYSKQKSVIV